MPARGKKLSRVFPFIFLTSLLLAFSAAVLTWALGSLIFSKPALFELTLLSITLFAFLLFFVIINIIWLPVWLSAIIRGAYEQEQNELTVKFKPQTIEKLARLKHVFLIVRGLLLTVFFVCIFPHHYLVQEFDRLPKVHPGLYFGFFFLPVLLLILLNTARLIKRQREINPAAEKKTKTSTSLAYPDVIAYILYFGFLFSFSMWMLCHFSGNASWSKPLKDLREAFTHYKSAIQHNQWQMVNWPAPTFREIKAEANTALRIFAAGKHSGFADFLPPSLAPKDSLRIFARIAKLDSTADSKRKLNLLSAFLAKTDSFVISHVMRAFADGEDSLVAKHPLKIDSLRFANFFSTRFAIRDSLRLSPVVSALISGRVANILDKINRQEQPRLSNEVKGIKFTSFISWICASLLLLMFLMLLVVVPYRLMRVVLFKPFFYETANKLPHPITQSHLYTWHFWGAIVRDHPIIIVGGMVLTIFLLGAPIVLKAFGRLDFIAAIISADIVLFGLGVFIAWFGPMALAASKADETFGEYFNQRLSDLIMTIQGHTILVGYGNLGKRVADREMQSLYETGGNFSKIVSPDLRIETMCKDLMVIEENDQDFLFSAGNDLLGRFGVVAAGKKVLEKYQPDEQPELQRVLVPILQGHAGQPFVFSRVNLPRARLLFGTSSEESHVEAVFNAAVEAKNKTLKTVLCVTRSDQLSYLTYQASNKGVTLLYPRFNQGVELGKRLWAAILKFRAFDKEKNNRDRWPKVLVVGNSKANHYMLETLWTNLPDRYQDKAAILESCVAYLLIDRTPTAGHAIVKPKAKASIPLEEKSTGENADKIPTDAAAKVSAGKAAGTAKANSDGVVAKDYSCFDLIWPATYITSSRHPISSDGKSDTRALKIQSRLLNTADVFGLEECLWEYRPDILLINDDDVETSLMILLRLVRALERLECRDHVDFKLPLMLMAGARSDDSEKRHLGDASNFYSGMMKLYREEIAEDISYPNFASYVRQDARGLLGESISDSLADTEEMIAGIRSSLEKPNYIEVNACLPNVPGALLRYMARLAGFAVPKRRTDIALPSFQYLRNIRLGQAGARFALTGYAIIVPPSQKAPPGETNQKILARRVFANDGTRHTKTSEHQRPGALEAINLIMDRKEESLPLVKDFYQALLHDPKYERSHGPLSCPGITTCPIANYQDYIVASNKNILVNFLRSDEKDSVTNTIQDAENYYCSVNSDTASPEKGEVPNPDSHYARIFCCAHSADTPGSLARALNCLLLGDKLEFEPTPEQNEKGVLNIEYFNELNCQNSHFTLNRLFGCFQKIDSNIKSAKPVPLDLIRILPIGTRQTSEHWYNYALQLYDYLQKLIAPIQLNFIWMDQEGNEHDKKVEPNVEPNFEETSRIGLPVVAITIGRSETNAETNCAFCGQSAAFDCKTLRIEPKTS